MRPPRRPKPVSDARQLALRLLARREHSRLELAQKLRQRGVDPATLETILDHLQMQDLLSEARFMESFIRHRVQQGYGSLRISAELRQRGLEIAQIREALSQTLHNEPDIARQALYHRFGHAPAETTQERARRLRFLLQRGFPAPLSYQVLEQDPCSDDEGF